jgi:hypothetical protein
MSVLEKLTEGLVSRDLRKEGEAVVSKWDKTGLLEGLNGNNRSTMARLLENQAKELLREASSMAAGDVEGFAAVAFPIVRRVFGGLVANDLVSVQPMSLPSGLIFFLDFTYELDAYGTTTGIDNSLQETSVYGGNVVGAELTGGVASLEEKGGGFYNLANAYSSPTGSAVLGTDKSTTALAAVTNWSAGGHLVSAFTEAQKKDVQYDPDLLADTTADVILLSFTAPSDLNKNMVKAINFRTLGAEDEHIRRLTTISGDTVTCVFMDTTSNDVAAAASDTPTIQYPKADAFGNADGAIGAVVGTADWSLEEPQVGTGNFGDDNNKNEIAEIDIKVDSIAVTAITKKLKAKWSPELGQDLNAYHNLDAEVELTSILSEHIALEIDREILNDLIEGATAGTYYWSRSPGLFVHRTLGTELGATAAAPDFTGTVSEWYETLVETLNDVSAQIHRKTLRGGATFLVTSPEVANILEFTSGFRANITHDDDKGTVGAVKAGNLSKKWDVFVDPYFPRNLVLVGRKGGSFLESGYVYAPYVPLQVTPTIFGTEDFVPRKGVMTRYAKKMVRPDMYGLVVVRGLLGESGAS